MTKKTADKYKITSIQQLQDPEIAKLFDSDRDGKANLVGCNPGWGCESIIDEHLKTYGLEDTVEHNKGQYTVLLADAITRYKQGQAIIYYAYNPHWISTVLKPGEDVVWLSVDGKNLGFSGSKQQIVANKTFLEANPVAKRWFELVQIPVADMNTESLRIKNGEDKPEDILRHAQEWVKNNQQKYDSWLEIARQEASSTINN
ncbi:MAG: glycine betaine/L-proline ABC transporter substrate-binding protein ProX [Cyanobacteriota bacterium]|nr:glycine betaine/L-proline ABC transporter substrate-binding protein ProX [Cyanobacteriota bacterium]